MANYKRAYSETITIAGTKIHVPPEAKIVMLTENTALSSAADSMREILTGAVYQSSNSTPGFQPIGMYINVNGTNGFLDVWTGTTEDAKSTQLAKIYFGTIAGTLEIYIGESASVDDEGFLVIDPSTTNINHISIIGYEYP